MVIMLPYGNPIPYFIIATSVSLALGGLIVGSATVFIIHCTNPKWFRKVRHLVHIFPPTIGKAEWSIKQRMMSLRFHVWATLLMLSIPCLSLMCLIGCAGVGE